MEENNTSAGKALIAELSPSDQPFREIQRRTIEALKETIEALEERAMLQEARIAHLESKVEPPQ